MADQFELPLFERTQPSRPAEPVRIFAGWEAPLLTLAVEHLAGGWQGGTLDLRAKFVVVPTSQAGRRLRAALAVRAAEQGCGVLPPSVCTPDYLLSAACLPDPSAIVASRPEVLVAWAETLLAADLDDFRAVFPIDPIERTSAWALRTAEELLSVQNLLGETGETIQSAAEKLAAEGMEPQRWAELARLEKLAHAVLESRNRLSPQAVRKEAARKGVLPDEIEALVVLGVPDPPPLFSVALDHHAATIPCEILVHAPSELSESFDRHGRPLTQEWSHRHIDLPDPAHTVHQAVNPQAQAEQCVRLLARIENVSAVAAVGAPDAELLLPLEEAFAAQGKAVFNPAGEPVSRQALLSVLRTLSRIAQSRSFLSFLELLRVPGAASAACGWQVTDKRTPFEPAHLLAELDRFQHDHLPETLDAASEINRSCARSSPAVSRALSWMGSWLRRLEQDEIWKSLPELLGEIYAETEFDPSSAHDEAFVATSRLLHGVLDTIENGLLEDLALAPALPERLHLVLHLLDRETIYRDRKAGAIDLQGWMELAWEDAPCLVMAGLNDGIVPEAIQGHAFLPDSARRVLGLRTNEGRHARDVYLLSALLACRRSTGRVDLLFGRRSASEEPLRPSRLLFACPAEELAARVRLFFEETLPVAPSPPWSLSWRLLPPAPDDELRIFSRLPVTAFRDYLSCPFRFYLRRGLRMEREEGPLAEMDARSFGTLCHLVVEEFATSAVRDSNSEKEIATFFADVLDSLVRREFGEQLPVPVYVQRESARQRLTWWAAIEAQQRQEGWEIVECERALDSEEEPWLVGGVRITGKIDRVERHTKSSTLRVLDFKTGRLKQPQEAHLRNLRRHENPSDLPPFMMAPGEKPQRWVDLQLPLYLLALRASGVADPLVAGYANLGRAKGEVALAVWDNLDDLLPSAQACVEGVVAAITARRFWPPSEKVEFDDYAPIFLGDATQAIEPAALLSES